MESANGEALENETKGTSYLDEFKRESHEYFSRHSKETDGAISQNPDNIYGMINERTNICDNSFPMKDSD